MPAKGWWCLLLGTCLLYVLSLSPMGSALAYLWAKDYPPIEEEQLQDLDVMVILGAGVGGTLQEPYLVDASAMRFLYGMEKFKKSKAKLLVFSGGRGAGLVSNAAVMARLARLFGVPEEKMLLESNSRTTWEQALEVSKLLKRRDLTIGIVTSAIHMRRSLQSFGSFFPKVVPLPFDSISWPKWNIASLIPSSGALSGTSAILHEYLGLAWYGLRSQLR